jgi:hypothetical protein
MTHVVRLPMSIIEPASSSSPITKADRVIHFESETFDVTVAQALGSGTHDGFKNGLRVRDRANLARAFVGPADGAATPSITARTLSRSSAAKLPRG